MNEVIVDGAELTRGFKQLGRARFRDLERLDVVCTDAMLWFGVHPRGFGVRYEGTWEARFTVRAKALQALNNPKAFPSRPVKIWYDGQDLHLDIFKFPTWPNE